MNSTYFVDLLQTIREEESAILYNNLPEISDAEKQQAIIYLRKTYHEECIGYPRGYPPFDEKAALWGAQILYISCQLVLFRKQNLEDIQVLLNDFSSPKTPSTILSADLMLRFLPSVIEILQSLTPEDPLIELLTQLLEKWHYSGIAFPLNSENLSFETELQDPCLRQLYLDRVVEKSRLDLIENPILNPLLRANYGIHYQYFTR